MGLDFAFEPQQLHGRNTPAQYFEAPGVEFVMLLSEFTPLMLISDGIMLPIFVYLRWRM